MLELPNLVFVLETPGLLLPTRQGSSPASPQQPVHSLRALCFLLDVQHICLSQVGNHVGCLCLLVSPGGGRVACALPLSHPTTLFPGKTLIKVSEAEKHLGAAERDFIHTASLSFLTPLRNFLEGDWKTISVRSLGPLLRTLYIGFHPGQGTQTSSEVTPAG